jgi:5'-3' exonuclease
VEVHLVDGTYELFRHFYGRPRSRSAPAPDDGREPVAAARGVAFTVVQMLEDGITHVGVATDHVIESFRNDRWAGYKDGSGIEPDLKAQFGLVEEALAILGVALWPMVELEADDALASAAAVAADDRAVDRVVIWTPDKDLAQCVVGDRVVQRDRRKGETIDEAGVVAKYGVPPSAIAPWLALVGDSADGFPGLPGWGKRSAALVLSHYGTLDAVPDEVADWDPALRKAVRGADGLAATLAAGRDLAELFLDLATLRVDRSLLAQTDDLRWAGPAGDVDALAERLRAPGLPARVAALAPA